MIRPGAPLRLPRLASLAIPLAVLLGATGCDDQVKYVSWFETMTEQPSVGTYQEAPLVLLT